MRVRNLTKLTVPALMMVLCSLLCLGVLSGCGEDSSAYKEVASAELQNIAHPSAEVLASEQKMDLSKPENKLALDLLTIVAPATKYEIGEPVKVEKGVYDVPVTLTLVPLSEVTQCMKNIESRIDPNNPPTDNDALYDLMRKVVKEDFEAEKFKTITGNFNMRVKNVDGVLQADPNDPANKPLYNFYVSGEQPK